MSKFTPGPWKYLEWGARIVRTCMHEIEGEAK